MATSDCPVSVQHEDHHNHDEDINDDGRREGRTVDVAELSLLLGKEIWLRVSHTWASKAGGGGRGTRPPQWKNQRGRSPRNDDILVSFS